MSSYYDRQGNPMTLEAWAESIQTGYPRTLAHEKWQTPVGEEVLVSTVWLGLNHAFGDGPPLIFETMIFGGAHDAYCDRYSTEEQALAGHAKAVTLARGELT